MKLSVDPMSVSSDTQIRRILTGADSPWPLWRDRHM